jgi:hypothetical protein
MIGDDNGSYDHRGVSGGQPAVDAPGISRSRLEVRNVLPHGRSAVFQEHKNSPRPEAQTASAIRDDKRPLHGQWTRSCFRGNCPVQGMNLTTRSVANCS